jgi:hypothetical protein
MQMTLQEIVERYRARIRLDQCGDPIIPGRRGHLYLDGDEICIMLADAVPVQRSRLEVLGGRVWQGDISPNSAGHKVQDAKVIGVKPEKIQRALKIIRLKPKRIMSLPQRDHAMRALQRARDFVRTPPQSISPLPESSVAASEVSQVPPAGSESE